MHGHRCGPFQTCVDEHKDIHELHTLLAESGRPLAGAILHLLDPLAHDRFPILIANTHTARHMFTHIRRQVRAYPVLVDRWDVSRTMLEDFQVCDPPVNVRTHSLRNAGAVFRP